MRTRSAAVSLASAVALFVVANPLAAQRNSATPEGNARVVATFNFRHAPTDLALPSSVTVVDSAGTLVANVMQVGGVAIHPMTVTAMESHLVLQGNTRDGVLTLVLDRQNEGGQTKLATGSWTLGRFEGKLRGIAQR
jgi:hypothetical protein